jgi:endonuclease/exonuclease/phosphatase family metal-dependent hydrolase
MLHALGRRIRGETFARVFQMQKLLEHVREHLESSGMPLIVAGDLNTVPRESQLDFAYSKAGDPDTYERDISLVLLRESKLLRTIPQLDGQGDPETIRPYWTYPSDPDRTLDYIFVSAGLLIDDYSVVRDAVSDHLGVLASISIDQKASSGQRCSISP